MLDQVIITIITIPLQLFILITNPLLLLFIIIVLLFILVMILALLGFGQHNLALRSGDSGGCDDKASHPTWHSVIMFNITSIMTS